MIHFFRNNYKALLLGGVITIGFTILLMISERNFVIMFSEYDSRPLSLLINILVFLVCWLILASLLTRFPAYKIVGVLSLLVLASVAERYLHISRNPLTIPLIILFWLGVANLILPQFFKKYRVLILAVYGLLIAYFLYLFISTPNFNTQNRESFASFILFPLPVFAAIWGYEQWRWLRTLKTDKAQTELSLLKSQVDPHFFFNTLNNLYGLVLEKSDRAPDVILKLSDMMRYTIYKGKEEYVLLKDEISYLEDYIDLHKIRYRQQVDINFEKAVDEQIQITPLLFIILLENAFKHGIEKKRENAFIHIRLESQGNQLLFSIQNSFDASKPQGTPGIGLDNLKKRLAHTYPNRHNLTIKKGNNVYSAELSIELT
ncbi:MAG: histidine kinase [Bacteroidota bacterium]